MENVQFDNEAALLEYVSRLGPRKLFRGQVTHHIREDGAPSLCSSFSRRGCIPPLMHRWTFYAKQILHAHGIDVPADLVGIYLPNAILQHYGWRSFFIDFSADFHVAAWFASHRFVAKRVLSFSFDCFGQAVLLLHDAPEYELTSGVGHVYAVDLGLAALRGVNAHDLIRLGIPGRCRFNVQHAWLLGPIPQSAHGLLDPSTVVSHIEAPADVFAKCAMKLGLAQTRDVFPNAEEDTVLSQLMAIPWMRITETDGLGFPSTYERMLQIPEYDFNGRKYYEEETSFTSPIWFNRRRPRRQDAENVFRSALFVKAPETVYFGKPKPSGEPMPLFCGLLDEYSSIVVETEYFLKLPREVGGPFCTKGVLVRRDSAGIIEVNELVIDHPGTQIRAIGTNRGLHYRWQNARLERAAIAEDCPCRNEPRHLQHISVLEAVEWALANRRTRRVSKLSIAIEL